MADEINPFGKIEYEPFSIRATPAEDFSPMEAIRKQIFGSLGVPSHMLKPAVVTQPAHHIEMTFRTDASGLYHRIAFWGLVGIENPEARPVRFPPHKQYGKKINEQVVRRFKRRFRA